MIKHWDGKTGQWVKGFQHKHENLSLGPQQPYKSQARWRESVTPELGAEAAESWVFNGQLV